MKITKKNVFRIALVLLATSVVSFISTFLPVGHFFTASEFISDNGYMGIDHINNQYGSLEECASFGYLNCEEVSVPLGDVFPTVVVALLTGIFGVVAISLFFLKYVDSSDNQSA